MIQTLPTQEHNLRTQNSNKKSFNPFYTFPHIPKIHTYEHKYTFLSNPFYVSLAQSLRSQLCQSCGAIDVPSASNLKLERMEQPR